jgi:hypothetical protein
MTGGAPEKTQDLRKVPHRSMIGTRRVLLGESQSLLHQPRIQGKNTPAVIVKIYVFIGGFALEQDSLAAAL